MNRLCTLFGRVLPTIKLKEYAFGRVLPTIKLKEYTFWGAYELSNQVPEKGLDSSTPA